MGYAYIKFAQAKLELGRRLADSNELFWTNAEKGMYLAQSLRMWNALTEVWNAEYSFATSSASGYGDGGYGDGGYGDSGWYDLSGQGGYPRLRTVTDDEVYRLIQSLLLEPIVGGATWTGTSQFSMADLQGAVQRCRDEVIQATACSLAEVVLPIGATRRIQLPDTVLEPIRARFVPPDPTVGSAVTLTREDSLAFDCFYPNHLATARIPSSWDVVTGPPLALDFDTIPNIAGNCNLIALQSGAVFAPPVKTLLGIPNDWAWLLAWGALADLLSRESEATDLPRAAYFRKRYVDGIKIMQRSNWLLSAQINGVPCDTPSLKEQDNYSPEWQDDVKAWPALVNAGMDFVAPCPPVPTGGAPLNVNITVVGNAPVPVNDDDYVQCSRDVWDVILSEAQAIAMLKQGGAEALSCMELDKVFFQAAMDNNQRLLTMGLFTDMIRVQGQRQNQVQPRYADQG